MSIFIDFFLLLSSLFTFTIGLFLVLKKIKVI